MKDKTLTKLFERLETSKGFPALGSTVGTIIERLSHDSDDVEGCILSDFALTQAVLQLANSAMYAPFAKNVPSVSSALLVLGRIAVRNLVLNVPIVSVFDTPVGVELSKVQMSSALARIAMPDNAEEASIAAMFYNLGTLAAANYLPEDMARILTYCEDQATDKAALHVLGMTLGELGIEVAHYWKMPKSVMEVVDGTARPELLKAAQFANTVAHLIHTEQTEGIAAIVDSFNPPEGTRHLFENVIEDLILAQPLPAEKSKVDSLCTELEGLLWALADRKFTNPRELAKNLFISTESLLHTSHCLFAEQSLRGTLSVVEYRGERSATLAQFFKISDTQPNAFSIALQKNVDLALLDIPKLRSGTLPHWYSANVPGSRALLVMPIAHLMNVRAMLVFGWNRPMKFTDAEFELLRKIRALFEPMYVESTAYLTPRHSMVSH